MLKYTKPELSFIAMGAADVIATSAQTFVGDPYDNVRSGWISVLDKLGVIDADMQ
jgi:hypothetical protein